MLRYPFTRSTVHCMKVSFPCLLILGLSTPLAWAENEPQPPTRRILSEAVYLREPTDTHWQIRFTGKVPSLCGMYVVIHDAPGNVLYQGLVPHGSYSAREPFTISFKPDGKTGDYRVVFVGQQEDVLGIPQPVSDLPYEVYGGKWFSLDGDKLPVYFKAPPGVSEMAMGAFKAELRILNSNAEVLADTRTGGKQVENEKDKNWPYFSRNEKFVEFPIAPDALYSVDAGSTMYFKTRETVYLAFDPKKLFFPAPELNEVKWWRFIR